MATETPPNKTQAVTTTRQPDIAVLVEKNKAEFQKALGASIPVEFFNRVAITSIRKVPLLAQCTPISLMGELMSLAQIQLVPDGVLGEAYLVPFWNSKAKAYEAKLVIGYKGVVKLIRRNNEIANCHASVVYANDTFVCRYGTRRDLTHEPKLNGARGDWIGAYAYISYRNGGEDFVFVPAEYIERVKASSQGSTEPTSPWVVWPEPMWCKTAMKQLSKFADISPQTRETLSKDLDLGAIDVESSVSQAVAATEPTRLAREEDVAQAKQAALEAPKQQETVSNIINMQKPEPEKVPAKAPAPAAAPKQQAAPAATPPPAKPPAKPAAPAASRRTLVQEQMTPDELAKENERLLAEMKAKRQAKAAPAPEPTPEPEPDPEGDPFAPRPQAQAPEPEQEAGLGDSLFPEEDPV